MANLLGHIDGGYCVDFMSLRVDLVRVVKRVITSEKFGIYGSIGMF